MSELAKSVRRGIVSSFGAVIAASVVLGIAQLCLDIPDGILDAVSVVTLGAASYTAGYVSTQQYRSKGLAQGLLCGAGIFAAVFLLSLIFGQLVFSEIFAAKAAACIAAGILGGVIGVNTKKTKLRH